MRGSVLIKKNKKSLPEEFRVPWLELLGETREVFGQGDHFLISVSSTLRVTPSLPVPEGSIALKWHNCRSKIYCIASWVTELQSSALRVKLSLAKISCGLKFQRHSHWQREEKYFGSQVKVILTEKRKEQENGISWLIESLPAKEQAQYDEPGSTLKTVLQCPGPLPV